MSITGRPTKYDPSMIDRIEEYLINAVPENMDIPTHEGIALLLNVNPDTLYSWAKIHTEFSEALRKCKTLQKQHLIKTGIFGGKEINANIIALMLKVNHDMIETSKLQVEDASQKILTTKQYVDQQIQSVDGNIPQEQSGSEVYDDSRTAEDL